VDAVPHSAMTSLVERLAHTRDNLRPGRLKFLPEGGERSCLWGEMAVKDNEHWDIPFQELAKHLDIHHAQSTIERVMHMHLEIFRRKLCDKPHLNHQQNISKSLGASRRDLENVECKLRCVNFRRVSDHGKAFQLPFGVTGIPDDWFRSSMGVTVISLKSPETASDKAGSTAIHSKVVWET
jgi:hypothetical protein